MTFSSSVPGSSHTAIGKECQDRSLCYSDPITGLTVAIVSDGHGGEAYTHSARGASLACQCTIEVIKECLLGSNAGQQHIVWPTFFTALYTRWRNAVEADIEHGGDTSLTIKAYGCTLLCYLQLVPPDHDQPALWAAFQIGDGRCCFFDNDAHWHQPIPWDDRCFLNYTTSLCDYAPIPEFRYCCGTLDDMPHAVFLGSDGIDDTFGCEDLLYNFYQHLYDEALVIGEPQVVQQLPNVLTHYSEVGSHDDMSVAAIINL